MVGLGAESVDEAKTSIPSEATYQPVTGRSAESHVERLLTDPGKAHCRPKTEVTVRGKRSFNALCISGGNRLLILRPQHASACECLVEATTNLRRYQGQARIDFC